MGVPAEVRTMVTWDPKCLVRFRERWGLSKSDMVRELVRYDGLAMLNWPTYNRWEKGGEAADGASPRPAYQLAIERALEHIERRMAEERSPVVSSGRKNR